nr:NAC domain-containing protein [Tanacetum cinerariifolium]
MTPKADRPNRRTGDFGYWRMTHKFTTVYMCDDASGLEVRKKRCLAYFDASNMKSQWLMHEYTTIDPNILVGSREDKMKLTDWVLCEIYKKETDDSEQVFSARNQQLDIETREQHPRCRYYIANFYGDTPDNLAENHRHCENKWYFLTPRDRKYPNGNRPNKRIKNFGFWKATNNNVICDDVTGEIVGGRNSLAYYDKNSRKTPWRMHLYINKNPNILTGSRIDQMMKLSDWVLAKIYKKNVNQNDNSNGAYQVENMMNPEELMEDQNLLQDEPS